MGLKVALVVILAIGALVLGFAVGGMMKELDRTRQSLSTCTKEKKSLESETESLEKQLSVARERIESDSQDLEGLRGQLRNKLLPKANAGAARTSVTITVYAEKYPDAPISKSPLLLKSRDEGILKTSCGNFIFKAR